MTDHALTSGSVQMPEWPKSPPTADEMIRYAVARGLWVNGLAWGFVNGGDDRLTMLRHAYASVQTVHEHDIALLLKALKHLDPKVADECAAHVWSAADAGDSYGEWLWQWATEEGFDADAIHAAGEASAHASGESETR